MKKIFLLLISVLIGFSVFAKELDVPFTSYKENYFIYTESNINEYNENERLNEEIKTQISLLKELVNINNWTFNFVYTQRSFWQVYDNKHSRPFRETNYKPSLFFTTPNWKGVNFSSGYEHESNGGKEVYKKDGTKVNLSRSWDKTFIEIGLNYKYFEGYLRVWDVFLEEDWKESMVDYYGFGELNLTVKFSKIHLSATGRYNPNTKYGQKIINLSFPMLFINGYYFLQYFEGYGESLIDFNKFDKRCGIGIAFTR